MPEPELLAWIEYFKLYPFDDDARFNRPAALIATSMSGTDVNDLLRWLRQEKAPQGLTESDMKTLKAFNIKPPAGWQGLKEED